MITISMILINVTINGFITVTGTSCVFKTTINGLVSTAFSWEQKSAFKLERDKDLKVIVIIIDID